MHPERFAESCDRLYVRQSGSFTAAQRNQHGTVFQWQDPRYDVEVLYGRTIAGTTVNFEWFPEDRGTPIGDTENGTPLEIHSFDTEPENPLQSYLGLKLTHGDQWSYQVTNNGSTTETLTILWTLRRIPKGTARAVR